MKLEKIRHWTEELERGLSQTFGRDHDAIVAGVEGGWLEAYRLWDGEAYMITRVERGTLTCCCYQGARVCEAMRWMRARSAQLGLTDILFFTKRRGLARLLKEFRPAPEEQIYRIEVA